MPVVSIIMRSYGGRLPSLRPIQRFFNVGTSEPCISQQTQPPDNKAIGPLTLPINCWSKPIEPNSFIITAVNGGTRNKRSQNEGFNKLFNKVVLPLPKKPVSNVIGKRASPLGLGILLVILL